MENSQRIWKMLSTSWRDYKFRSLLTVLGGMTGAILVTKFWWSHRQKILDLQQNILPSFLFQASISPTKRTSVGPYSNEKLKEYYAFIEDALGPAKGSENCSILDASQGTIYRKKVALDLLKYLSGFATEQDRIREKKLIPVLLDTMEMSPVKDLQIASAFVISNISLQPRNHAQMNQLHTFPRMFQVANILRPVRIDALQLLMNLSYHPQNITDENLKQWDAVNRIVVWLDSSTTETELIMILKVLINLSYIPFYSQQIRLDQTLMKQIKIWCNSSNDDIRPRSRLLKENLK